MCLYVYIYTVYTHVYICVYIYTYINKPHLVKFMNAIKETINLFC